MTLDASALVVQHTRARTDRAFKNTNLDLDHKGCVGEERAEKKEKGRECTCAACISEP